MNRKVWNFILCLFLAGAVGSLWLLKFTEEGLPGKALFGPNKAAVRGQGNVIVQRDAFLRIWGAIAGVDDFGRKSHVQRERHDILFRLRACLDIHIPQQELTARDQNPEDLPQQIFMFFRFYKHKTKKGCHHVKGGVEELELPGIHHDLQRSGESLFQLA